MYKETVVQFEFSSIIERKSISSGVTSRCIGDGGGVGSK